MRAEEAKLTGRLCQIEERIRPKLESILSPVLGMENLELADIIDTHAIQSLMDDFYKFAHITMALLDLKGNVLVSIGWQDICTRFHRAHPETCKHCVEVIQSYLRAFSLESSSCTGAKTTFGT